MCDWCCKLDERMRTIQEDIHNGVCIGKPIKFYPWDKEDEIEINLWYMQEYGMDKKDFLIELEIWDSKDKKNGTRIIAPIKFCPNCGRKFERNISMKTISGNDFIKLLECIRRETRPIDGHPDPNAIDDCWNEVFEYLKSDQCLLWSE